MASLPLHCLQQSSIHNERERNREQEIQNPSAPAQTVAGSAAGPSIPPQRRWRVHLLLRRRRVQRRVHLLFRPRRVHCRVLLFRQRRVQRRVHLLFCLRRVQWRLNSAAACPSAYSAGFSGGSVYYSAAAGPSTTPPAVDSALDQALEHI